MKKVIGFGILAAVLLFVLIQLVPYGRQHNNPPVLQEPQWDKPETRALAQRACFDCHSNESVWPWYSNIAPVSWLTQHDVDEGRSRLNFSEAGSSGRGVREAAELIQEGEMPLPIYLLMHPSARLSEAEKQALIQGLEATYGFSGGN